MYHTLKSVDRDNIMKSNKQHNENQNKRYQRKFKSTLNKNRTANEKQQQQKLNDKIPKAAN